jgi:hypothetical protein
MAAAAALGSAAQAWGGGRRRRLVPLCWSCRCRAVAPAGCRLLPRSGAPRCRCHAAVTAPAAWSVAAAAQDWGLPGTGAAPGRGRCGGATPAAAAHRAVAAPRRRSTAAVCRSHARGVSLLPGPCPRSLQASRRRGLWMGRWQIAGAGCSGDGCFHDVALSLRRCLPGAPRQAGGRRRAAPRFDRQVNSVGALRRAALHRHHLLAPPQPQNPCPRSLAAAYSLAARRQPVLQAAASGWAPRGRRDWARLGGPWQ